MKNLSVILAITLISILFSGCFKDYVDPNYTNVKITKIILEDMPFLDASSSGWDNSNGPDVYIELQDAVGNALVTGNTVWDISESSLPISWNLNNAYEVNNLATTYAVVVYDDDSDQLFQNDDFIGGYTFNFQDNKENYPTTLILSLPSSKTVIKLSLIWY